MRTLEVEVSGSRFGTRVRAARASVRRSSGHLDPRRDTDPAQRLPPPKCAARRGDFGRRCSGPSNAWAWSRHVRRETMAKKMVASGDWQELIGALRAQDRGGPRWRARRRHLLAEPLERGLPVTLEQPQLRRVLLSSLQGDGTVTADSRFEGVLHEFSSIAGGARGRHRDRAQRRQGQIAAHASPRGASSRLARRGPRGPARSRAGQIQAIADRRGDSPIPNWCSARSMKKVDFRMELTVASGKGYVPAERNRPEDARPSASCPSIRCSRR